MIYSTTKVRDQKSLNERRGGRFDEFYAAIKVIPRIGTYPLIVDVYDYRLSWNEEDSKWVESLYFTKPLKKTEKETDVLIGLLNSTNDVSTLMDDLSLEENNLLNIWGVQWSLTPPNNE